MSTGYQAHKAQGTKARCRLGKVRHTITMDRDVFDAIRESAMKNRRAVAEEMSERLKASVAEGGKN